MNGVADRRSEIYDYFHSSVSCQQYFLNHAHEEEYVAYYNSMYLLQDSTEGLLQHRERGFSPDPLIAYIEFWGVMQAAIIQQDSIAEIYELIVRKPLDSKGANLSSWCKVRELRNICAGHPAKKDRPKTAPSTRAFMGRVFGSYQAIHYELWEAGAGTTNPIVLLGNLLDAYAIEAESQLAYALRTMKARWA